MEYREAELLEYPARRALLAGRLDEHGCPPPPAKRSSGGCCNWCGSSDRQWQWTILNDDSDSGSESSDDEDKPTTRRGCCQNFRRSVRQHPIWRYVPMLLSSIAFTITEYLCTCRHCRCCCCVASTAHKIHTTSAGDRQASDPLTIGGIDFRLVQGGVIGLRRSQQRGTSVRHALMLGRAVQVQQGPPERNHRQKALSVGPAASNHQSNSLTIQLVRIRSRTRNVHVGVVSSDFVSALQASMEAQGVPHRDQNPTMGDMVPTRTVTQSSVVDDTSIADLQERQQLAKRALARQTNTLRHSRSNKRRKHTNGRRPTHVDLVQAQKRTAKRVQRALTKVGLLSFHRMRTLEWAEESARVTRYGLRSGRTGGWFGTSPHGWSLNLGSGECGHSRWRSVTGQSGLAGIWMPIGAHSSTDDVWFETTIIVAIHTVNR